MQVRRQAKRLAAHYRNSADRIERLSDSDLYLPDGTSRHMRMVTDILSELRAQVGNQTMVELLVEAGADAQREHDLHSKERS